MAVPDSTRIPPAQPFPRIRKGDAVITLQEMVEALLWDFAEPAQQDEDRAYQNYRKFIDSSEQVMVAHQERRRFVLGVKKGEI
jgi:hypothetical protein